MPEQAVEGLARHAVDAARAAYAPYSRFRVGAAVLAGGDIFTGCNIENASYGLCICAERVAVFKAVAAGHRRLEGVAVACIDAPGTGNLAELMPCGACRQVLAEFGWPDLPVEVVGAGVFTLANLLPSPFTLGQSVPERAKAE